MTFGKPQFNKNYEWELIRYATSKHIIGGASKLLTHFERTYKPKSIITYADRRFSQGNMYFKLGFNLNENMSPNYIWVTNNSNLSPIYDQTDNIKNILKNSYNQNLSIIENMSLNQFLQIYDAGKLTFIKIY